MESSDSIVVQLKMENEFLKSAIRKNEIAHAQQKIVLFNNLAEKYGEDAKKLIEETNSDLTCALYKKMSENLPDRSIESLISILWEPLQKRGVKYTYEKIDNGYKMNCTACPMADIYKSLGGSDWGFSLFCSTDEQIVKDFNPKIGFSRTKTLMQGDDCCDHVYFIKD